MVMVALMRHGLIPTIQRDCGKIANDKKQSLIGDTDERDVLNQMKYTAELCVKIDDEFYGSYGLTLWPDPTLIQIELIRGIRGTTAGLAPILLLRFINVCWEDDYC